MPVFGYPISEPFMKMAFWFSTSNARAWSTIPNSRAHAGKWNWADLGVSDAAQRGLLNTPAFAAARAPQRDHPGGRDAL